MSLEVAKVISNVKQSTGDTYTNAQIASALAVICGVISAGIGFLRIGFILEFIPGESPVFWLGICSTYTDPLSYSKPLLLLDS